MHRVDDGAAAPSGEILTSRLILRLATVRTLRADLDGRAALGRELGVHVPEDWPPDFYDAGAIQWTIRALEAHPSAAPWLGYYFLRRADPAVLIGVGGFKGPPDDDGVVEVGYSIVAGERRRGYATEAVRGFLAHAFADVRVRRVIAETLPELVASIGVLDKVGMILVARLRPDQPPGAPGWREQEIIRFEMDRARYEYLVHGVSA
jgi:RimJ/RimL family protein N-acetyltransferase